MLIPPAVLLLLRIVFAIVDFSAFPDEFENCSFHVFEEVCWDFDEDCIQSVDGLWWDGHFYYVNSANPKVWKIFPSSEIFFDFFLERLEVLIIQICRLFG